MSQFSQRSRLDRLSSVVNTTQQRRDTNSLNRNPPAAGRNMGRPPPARRSARGGNRPSDTEPLFVTVTNPKTGEKRRITVSTCIN